MLTRLNNFKWTGVHKIHTIEREHRHKATDAGTGHPISLGCRLAICVDVLTWCRMACSKASGRRAPSESSRAPPSVMLKKSSSDRLILGLKFC